MMIAFDGQSRRRYCEYILCAAACVALGCALMSNVGLSAPSRLVYNDDGFNFLGSGDELTVKDLRAYLGRLRGTQVDLVAYCVAEGGNVTLYESRIADPLGAGFPAWNRVRLRRIAHNRERLRDEAGDYIGAVFSILREMHIPAVASIRMNDAHMSSDPKGPLAGQFWKKHPEWRLGPPYGYYASCLNYAVPEVRDYLRKHYLFYTGSLANYRHYTQDAAAIDRAAPRPAELAFRSYDAADAKQRVLKVKVVSVTAREQFRFTLNGRPVAERDIQRLHAPGGRDARIHSIKLEPYSQFVLDLAPEALRRGANQLTVTLADQEADLTGKIELVELELVLDY